MATIEGTGSASGAAASKLRSATIASGRGREEEGSSGVYVRRPPTSTAVLATARLRGRLGGPPRPTRPTTPEAVTAARTRTSRFSVAVRGSAEDVAIPVRVATFTPVTGRRTTAGTGVGTLAVSRTPATDGPNADEAPRAVIARGRNAGTAKEGRTTAIVKRVALRAPVKATSRSSIALAPPRRPRATPTGATGTTAPVASAPV